MGAQGLSFGALLALLAALGRLLGGSGAVLGPLGPLLGPPGPLLGLMLASREASFWSFLGFFFKRPWKKTKTLISRVFQYSRESLLDITRYPFRAALR